MGHVDGGRVVSVAVEGQGAAPVDAQGRFELVVPDHQDKDLRLSGLLPQGPQIFATAPFDPCGGWSLLAPDPKASFSQCIRAHSGGVIEYQGVRLQVPPGALARDTRITVRALDVDETAKCGRGRTRLCPVSPSRG